MNGCYGGSVVSTVTSQKEGCVCVSLGGCSATDQRHACWVAWRFQIDSLYGCVCGVMSWLGRSMPSTRRQLHSHQDPQTQLTAASQNTMVQGWSGFIFLFSWFCWLAVLWRGCPGLMWLWVESSASLTSPLCGVQAYNRIGRKPFICHLHTYIRSGYIGSVVQNWKSGSYKYKQMHKLKMCTLQ